MAKEAAVVVFPTPPLPLLTTTTLPGMEIDDLYLGVLVSFTPLRTPLLNEDSIAPSYHSIFENSKSNAAKSWQLKVDLKKCTFRKNIRRVASSAMKAAAGGGRKRPKGNACFEFQKTGSCSKAECRFEHSMQSSSNDVPAPAPKREKTAGKAAGECRDFERKGSCRYGDECKFSHGTGGGASMGARPPAAPQAAAHIPSVRDLEAAGSKMVVEEPIRKSGSAMKFSNDRFADLPINALTRRALAETFKYEFMSPVQSETLPPILHGKDCLAKAKTGTGKTLGFLIPTIEKVIGLRDANMIVGNLIPCLVLSPTRELAAQIAKEAELLLTFIPKMTTVTIFGGTNINKDVRALSGRVDFLVATPGRLLDHLQNYGLAQRLAMVNTLIMDEADQLLDMGFRPDIEKILRLLEPSKGTRQTLLFSATVPPSVKEIAKLSLRAGYSFVDTVGEEQEQTHKHVRQEIVVCGNDAQVVHMAAALDQHIAAVPDAKVMVFFCTARLTQSMALLFQSMGYSNVMQIHSRLSQPARTKVSERFKQSRSAILFSSDVSARGMDYPDVTFVLQVGIVEREQYIHRLGRTARAGKSGGGMIILAPYEHNSMRRDLKDMPLQDSYPPITPALTNKVNTALSRVPGNAELKAATEQAYRAWLGYYNGNLRKCGFDKPSLVQEANRVAGYLGLVQQPSLLKKTVGMMGMKGVPGLIIE
jgi:ATP-dependent RNA helicase MSS116